MASQKNGTLYTGITKDLVGRVYQHKNDYVEGFTKKYQIHNLVYYEQYDNAESAIIREKRLKKWNRSWKIKLIDEMNPSWTDLYEDFMDSQSSWE